jgi:hypothetical protein
MSNQNITNFYNASRMPLKPTTLHDGNISPQQYKMVVQNRVSLTCYESMPTRRTPAHSDKENKYKANYSL